MLQNNTVNKVISIVAAIVIWAYVVSIINPPTTHIIRDVPVTLVNTDSLIEKGLTLESENNFTVNVTVKGTRSEVNELDIEDITATADLLGFPKGDSEVNVNVEVPDNVRLENVSPERITVDIEEYVTVNKPIDLSFSGAFADNTEPGNVKMVPEEIEVSGAKSKVDDIEYIKAEVNSSEVESTEKTMKVDAIPINKDGEEVTDLKLSQDEIEVTCMLLHTKTVPLEVNTRGEVSSEYNVTSMDIPDQITIKGSESALNKIKRVKSRTVDISKITETTEIPLRFNLPEGVELADKSENISLNIVISGIVKKDFKFSASEIEMENIPENLNVHVNTGTITITVYGEKDIMDEFSKSDIEPYVDLSYIDEESEGENVTVKFRYDKDIEKVESDPKEVHVIIRKTS